MTEITQNSSANISSANIKNEILATAKQIGFLNSRLPFGYRLEPFEEFQKHASHSKSSKHKKTVFVLCLSRTPRSVRLPRD